MLKKIKNRFRRKNKSQSNTRPEEQLRDAIISAVIETAKQSGYEAGNTTLNLYKAASQVVKHHILWVKSDTKPLQTLPEVM